MSAKRFFLFANPGKPETVSSAGALADALIARKCSVHLDEWLYDELRVGERSCFTAIDGTYDAVVSFGGDGTLLRAIHASASHGVPVLGVNLGHTGFLLEMTPDGVVDIPGRLISGDYGVEERMLLRGTVKDGRSALSMNEVSLTRGQNPNSLVIDVIADGALAYTVHGDGALVSTPSGSTGYCLSAGGPVVHPELPCLIVVPICSHIMHQRPIVLPAESEVLLRVRAHRGRPHQVSMDGQVVLDLEGETEVKVTIAQEKARLIRLKEQCFISRLRQKQLEWGNHVYGGNK